MDALVFGAGALLICMSAAVRLCYVRKRRKLVTHHVARRARAVAFSTGFVFACLAIPEIADVVDPFITINEVSHLLSCGTAVIFWTSLQVMIVDWTYSREHVRTGVTVRITAACGVLLAMAWEFHLIDTAHVEVTTEFAHNDGVAAFLLTYLGFTAVAGLEICVCSIVLAAAARRQHRVAATGLSIAAAGGLCGIAYAISRGGYVVVSRHWDAWPLALEQAVSPTLAALAPICVAIGLAWATIGYRSARANPLSPATSRR
ncbi:hypothetical protein [Streptomyces tubercidicus]